MDWKKTEVGLFTRLLCRYCRNERCLNHRNAHHSVDFTGDGLVRIYMWEYHGEGLLRKSFSADELVLLVPYHDVFLTLASEETTQSSPVMRWTSPRPPHGNRDAAVKSEPPGHHCGQKQIEPVCRGSMVDNEYVQ